MKSLIYPETINGGANLASVSQEQPGAFPKDITFLTSNAIDPDGFAILDAKLRAKSDAYKGQSTEYVRHRKIMDANVGIKDWLNTGIRLLKKYLYTRSYDPNLYPNLLKWIEQRPEANTVAKFEARLSTFKNQITNIGSPGHPGVNISLARELLQECEDALMQQVRTLLDMVTEVASTEKNLIGIHKIHREYY